MKLAVIIVGVLILSYLTFIYFNGDNVIFAGWNTIVYPPYFIVATVSLFLCWLVAILYLAKRIIKSKR